MLSTFVYLGIFVIHTLLIYLKLPLGPWAKDSNMREVGRYQQVQQILAIQSYAPGFFSRVLGWTALEVQVLIAKIRNELLDKSIHMYIPCYFVYGRKPPE